MNGRTQGKKYQSVAKSNAQLDGEPYERSSVQQIIMRLAILTGGILLFYHSRVPYLLLDPIPLYRYPFYVGLVLFSIFLIVTIALVIWRQVLQRGATYRHFKLRSRRPVVIMTLSGVLAFFSFSAAFWPVYGIWSPMLFTIFSYAILCALSFV
jgi:hypothetical protein